MVLNGRTSGGGGRRGVGLLVVVGLVLAGCADASSSDASDGAELRLDLETGEAETVAGTVQAQRADHSYVAAIGDGRAIGVTTAADVGVEPDTPQKPDGEQIVVYVYDREELAILTGALGADSSASFTSGEHADFDTTVDLATINEDAVSGTVTVGDEQPVEFTAEAATGDAGVYWADGATDDPDVSCDWVVLPDGNQWGCACVPPTFNNPCCHLRH